MSSTKINQKEYLKKYLSSNIGDEKKKKKKKSKLKKTVKIIDDDIDLSKIETNEDDMDIFQTGEDAPQIVGVIDDRPPELQALDYQNSNKWKAVSNDNFTNMLNSNKSSSSKSILIIDSPPRKSKKKKESKNSSLDNDDLSLNRRMNNSKHKDTSPPRKYSDDISPKRRKASKYSDDDLSPKRYSNRKDSDGDLSPKRTKTKRRSRSKELSSKRYTRQKDSDEDLSPKRSTNRRYHDDDLSPKRSKRRQDDLSPIGNRNNTNYSTNKNQKPYRSRSDSDVDFSPKQITARKTSEEDLSPKRIQTKIYSPKRTKKSRFDAPYQRRSTSQDYSPKRRSPSNVKNQPSSSRNRKSRSASLDLSPRRTSTNKIPEQHKRRDHYSRSSPSPPRHIKIEKEESPPPTHSKKMTKTLDGKTAGLSDARALRVENAKFKEREQTLFEKMTDEMSGRNADVVMRDRSTGKRRNFAEESEKQRKKDEKQKAKKALYDRWGAGLKQVEEHSARLDEISHEMSKPLARYSNDEDLDDYLKKQERAGDPMLEYIRQKEREKNKKQGIPQMPKYEGSFPDNRFNIPPGYRWDGVDRSNGFEKKWFETISKRKAVEEEAYRYSTEDM